MGLGLGSAGMPPQATVSARNQALSSIADLVERTME
jgi:hypothetical protein